ncbi:tRNA (adenine(22)-N(1))-methyltransferase [Clostridium paridis]|uniref:SAM-dependent methyltransferase n=1 Tax=Clostridium paridis TaxID=2803863 RepID=A0A937FIY3_9CLOT|nr:class I SAM-dependent methyltransferase [Clostridium paridis]MBL4933018.1 SAM-dependent methyltransferase [Clostridium paridis]
MELSQRLKCIIQNMNKCQSIIDVGTDHGYIPIHAVENGIVDFAIASDINKGPKEKAERNVRLLGLSDKIECRLGAGLNTVKEKEVEAVIMAGMGGNLIRDIIIQDINKVKYFKYMILMPAQNPEILREFLYNNSFEIIKEDLCFEDGIFYEVFKVRYSEQAINDNMDAFDYEFSPILIKDKHKLLKDFAESKISKYTAILSYINDDSPGARIRKSEIEKKILRIKEIAI